MKKARLLGAAIAMIAVLAAGCGGPSQEEYDQLSAEYESLSQLTEKLRADYDELTKQYDQLQADYQSLQTEKEAVEQEYQSYQEFVYPYYEYIQGLQAQQQADELYQLAQTYETGITYEDLVERPDACMGQRFHFLGTIVGGSVENGVLNLIFAEDGDEENLLLLSGSADWAAGVEEGLQVNVYGTSGGLTDYAAEDGEETQIPAASLDYITQG